MAVWPILKEVKEVQPMLTPRWRALPFVRVCGPEECGSVPRALSPQGGKTVTSFSPISHAA